MGGGGVTLFAMLMGGLLNSGHCVGMCGGFVVTIGANRKGLSENLRRQIVYALGRIFTYGFLGAMAGSVGAYVEQLNLPFLSLQRTISLVGGAIMILIGLNRLGVVRWSRKSKGQSCSGLNESLLGHFLRLPATAAVFLAGVFTGFLPCWLVYAFLMLAMATGNPVQGWLAMAAFGIGTAPALIALGCGSSLLSLAARRKVQHLAACFVVVLGGMTIYRGWPREAPCCHADTDVRVVGEGAAATSTS